MRLRMYVVRARLINKMEKCVKVKKKKLNRGEIMPVIVQLKSCTYQKRNVILVNDALPYPSMLKPLLNNLRKRSHSNGAATWVNGDEKIQIFFTYTLHQFVESAKKQSDDLKGEYLSNVHYLNYDDKNFIKIAKIIVHLRILKYIEKLIYFYIRGSKFIKRNGEI